VHRHGIALADVGEHTFKFEALCVFTGGFIGEDLAYLDLPQLPASALEEVSK
jgi:hypothetical protein